MSQKKASSTSRRRSGRTRKLSLKNGDSRETWHESEARFRAMFEQTRVGMVRVDKDGRFLEVNQGFCDFIGYSREELRSLLVRNVSHPADFLAMQEQSRRLHAGELSELTVEKRYVRKSGEIAWAMVTGTLVRQGNGAPHYVLAIVQSIDEKKRAEERLRATEERFRQFAENSADVFWIVNTKPPKYRLEYVNPAFEDIFGESRERVKADVHYWNQLIHPTDLAQSQISLPKLSNGDKTHTVEYRVVQPGTGKVRWVRDTGFPIRDENGEIESVAGVAQDVTEARERMERLGVTEERFRLLVEGAREYAMFLLDPANVITYWSHGAERIFGWKAEEAIGQSGNLIFTPEDRAAKIERKEIEKALRRGTSSDRRWHRRKNGSRVWIDGVMQRLTEEKTGALRGFAKIARDATKEWKASEKLRRAHDQLEQRVRARTAQLQATNDALENEMGRRRELEREILQVTERERAKIGQDLHDSLCQELTATAFLLKSHARKFRRSGGRAARALDEAAETVNANAGLARDLARGIHPFELGSAGLVSALRELCLRTNERLHCRCQIARSLRLNDNLSVNLYRIAYEAVANTLKHAQATDVSIDLRRGGGEILLQVGDNGKRAGRIRAGLGLHLMKYRANAIGGNLEVKSRRGEGTTVCCRVKG